MLQGLQLCGQVRLRHPGQLRLRLHAGASGPLCHRDQHLQSWRGTRRDRQICDPGRVRRRRRRAGAADRHRRAEDRITLPALMRRRWTIAAACRVAARRAREGADAAQHRLSGDRQPGRADRHRRLHGERPRWRPGQHRGRADRSETAQGAAETHIAREDVMTGRKGTCRLVALAAMLTLTLAAPPPAAAQSGGRLEYAVKFVCGTNARPLEPRRRGRHLFHRGQHPQSVHRRRAAQPQGRAGRARPADAADADHLARSG